MNETEPKSKKRQRREQLLKEIRQKPSILDRLRLQLVDTNPTTREGKKYKAVLILEHSSKLPAKLRPRIAESREVYESGKYGLFFTIISTHFKRLVKSGGLDNTIDTEEEVELAIRLFPNAILDLDFPIREALTKNAKMISFIPLFVKLLIVERNKIERRQSPVGFLFCNLLCPKEKEGYEERGNDCLAMATRLKEMGLVKKTDLSAEYFFLTVVILCRRANISPAVVESRVRYMIGWNPLLLRSGWQRSDRGPRSRADDSFLKKFSRFLIPSHNDHGLFNNGTSQFWNSRNCIKIFEILFESGLNYYPKEMGFIFHDDTYCSFCSRFGRKEITDIVRSKLLDFVVENKESLQALVCKVAADTNISLDLLFLLILCDPARALESSRANKKRSESNPPQNLARRAKNRKLM